MNLEVGYLTGKCERFTPEISMQYIGNFHKLGQILNTIICRWMVTMLEV